MTVFSQQEALTLSLLVFARPISGSEYNVKKPQMRQKPKCTAKIYYSLLFKHWTNISKAPSEMPELEEGPFKLLRATECSDRAGVSTRKFLAPVLKFRLL